MLENSPDMGRHRLLQAILRRCDCLISYVYLELRGEEAQILSSVRRPEETDCAGRHRPGHRRLSERAHPGPAAGRAAGFPGRGPCAAPAVSEELGISTASLSKMAYKTRVALLKQLIARYEMMRREGPSPWWWD